MSANTTIVWFRLDLRLRDNPALDAAVARGGPVVPVFIWAPDEEAPWAPGAASRWWLHESLASLQRVLSERGSRLVIRAGPSTATVAALVAETGANAVFWNRRYEPALVARDARMKAFCGEQGWQARSFNSALLFEPWELQTVTKKPYQVFTPFWKACVARHATIARPSDAPSHLQAPERWPDSIALSALRLQPAHPWADGFRDAWTPGETGATGLLGEFLSRALPAYRQGRDRPDWSGTSRLSPHLHFGELSARTVWHAVAGSRSVDAAADYLRELGWREFAHHLLFHFPHTPERPLRPSFERFPWAPDAKRQRAWQRGQTGYPLVDAGMRQLWQTGWMHNRVRMVVASFLVKDLLIPWQVGTRWFWDTLVDADLANNTLGWQWTAGCGADAAPFFRIFNPASQAAKFDPAGDYVRRWIPELGTPEYSPTIVDHREARERALSAYRRLSAPRTNGEQT